MNPQDIIHPAISGADKEQTEEDLIQARLNPTLSDPSWSYNFLNSPEQQETSSTGSLLDHLKMVSGKEDSIQLLNKKNDKVISSEIQLMFLNMLPISNEARIELAKSLVE